MVGNYAYSDKQLVLFPGHSQAIPNARIFDHLQYANTAVFAIRYMY